MAKISVIGAGFVGATVAQRVVEKDLGDVVLLDIVEGVAEGKALDIMHSSGLEGFHSCIQGTTDYRLTQNSDIIVITAGLPRKPGMSREDLLFKNAQIVKDIVINVLQYNKNPVIIMVTNPLDVMSYLAYRVSGLSSNRVIGMAGILDSARFRYFIAKELNVAADNVEALVLGSHGDLMVPLLRYASVNGIPLTNLLSKEKINEICERTKKAGGEVVHLLKTGSAYFAPSSSVVKMVENILYNRREILPCSVYLDKQYGLEDVYCGVPVILGQSGVEEIIEIELDQEEIESLYRSAEAVKSNFEKISQYYQ